MVQLRLMSPGGLGDTYTYKHTPGAATYLPLIVMAT